MTDTQLLVAVLCISPLVTFGLCAVWRILELNSRDSDTRRYPRPGTHPERPDGFKPFKRHPDMLKKIDDE
jgi:hypothetical protein